MIQSSGDSSRGSKFGSQHQHGGCQPSITPGPGNLMFSSSLQTLYNTCGALTVKQSTHIHKYIHFKNKPL